jgi:hypothetical protein
LEIISIIPYNQKPGQRLLSTVGFFDTPRSSLTLAKEWPVKALKALKGQKLIMAEGIKGLSVY